MKTIDVHASDPTPRRVILVCGAVIAVLVFAFVVVGVVAEARQLLSEGASAFFSDAAVRIGLGACIALLSAVPYVLLARAARQPGPPRFFAIVSVLTLAVQLWFMANALFFGETSTAPIGMFFIPIYLCAAIVAIWGLAAIARFMQAPRRLR